MVNQVHALIFYFQPNISLSVIDAFKPYGSRLQPDNSPSKNDEK